jgi:flagellar assembly factor FliW
MKIVTLRFGELEIPDDKVIDFPKGLLGFEQFHK